MPLNVFANEKEHRCIRFPGPIHPRKNKNASRFVFQEYRPRTQSSLASHTPNPRHFSTLRSIHQLFQRAVMHVFQRMHFFPAVIPEQAYHLAGRYVSDQLKILFSCFLNVSLGVLRKVAEEFFIRGSKRKFTVDISFDKKRIPVEGIFRIEIDLDVTEFFGNGTQEFRYLFFGRRSFGEHPKLLGEERWIEVDRKSTRLNSSHRT